MEKDVIIVLIIIALFVIAILKIRSAQKKIEADTDRDEKTDTP